MSVSEHSLDETLVILIIKLYDIVRRGEATCACKVGEKPTLGKEFVGFLGRMRFSIRFSVEDICCPRFLIRVIHA